MRSSARCSMARSGLLSVRTPSSISAASSLPRAARWIVAFGQATEQLRVEAYADRKIRLGKTRERHQQQSGDEERAKLDAEADDQSNQGGDRERTRQSIDGRALVEQVGRGGRDITE